MTTRYTLGPMEPATPFKSAHRICSDLEAQIEALAMVEV